MTFRGIKVPFSSTIQLLGFAVLISAVPAHAKKKPSPTPSSLPPTSPMHSVPGATPSDEEPGKLINSDMSGRDLEFLTAVVSTGRAQTYLIDLLHTRASSDEIKKLAENLGIAQEAENKRIVSLAGKKGWNLSMAPTAELKKVGAELEKLQASNFDKAVMDKLVVSNVASLAALDGAAESTDPDIQTFATQMLPLAKEKGQVVEKMTGAGSETAAQLFRHSAAPSGSGDARPSPLRRWRKKNRRSNGANGHAQHHPKADEIQPQKPKARARRKRLRRLPSTPEAPVATPPGLSVLPRHVPPPIVPSTIPESTVPPISTPSTPAPVPSEICTARRHAFYRR